MNPINLALRPPKTVMVVLLAIAMAAISVIRPPTVDNWLRERGVKLPLKRMAVKLLLNRMTLGETYAA